MPPRKNKKNKKKQMIYKLDLTVILFNSAKCFLADFIWFYLQQKPHLDLNHYQYELYKL